MSVEETDAQLICQGTKNGKCIEDDHDVMIHSSYTSLKYTYFICIKYEWNN